MAISPGACFLSLRGLIGDIEEFVPNRDGLLPNGSGLATFSHRHRRLDAYGWKSEISAGHELLDPTIAWRNRRSRSIAEFS